MKAEPVRGLRRCPEWRAELQVVDRRLRYLVPLANHEGVCPEAPTAVVETRAP